MSWIDENGESDSLSKILFYSFHKKRPPEKNLRYACELNASLE